MNKLIITSLLLVACRRDDKAEVERATEHAADKIRSGAIEAKEKAKQVASEAHDQIEPELEALATKIRQASEDLANAPSETAREAARRALARLNEQKNALEHQLRR